MQQTQPDSVGSDEFMADLHKAVQLDPQYADAYHLLAFGEMKQRKYAEAEQDVRHAIELSPRNDGYRLNLAVILLNQQKLEEGKTVLASISQSSNPAVAGQANQMLQTISRMQSSALHPPTATAPPASAESSAAPEIRNLATRSRRFCTIRQASHGISERQDCRSGLFRGACGRADRTLVGKDVSLAHGRPAEACAHQCG